MKQRRNILLLLNGLLVLLTLGTYTANYCSPETNPIISILGLLYPILLMGNLVFIIIWAVFQPKWTFLSVFTILIGIGPIFSLIGFHSERDKEINTNSLNIATYNVQFAKPILLRKGSQRIALEKEYNRFLSGLSKVDLLCIKEQSTVVQKYIDANLELPYQTTSPGNYVRIYSKYPIIDSGTLPEFSKNPAIHAIWADILASGGKDTIRIYNIHFEPNSQDGSTPKVIVNTTKETPVNLPMALGILQNYPQSAIKRIRQVELLLKHQNSSPYKNIICADLNDTPQSYGYYKLFKIYKDSFRERGNGIGTTFGSTLMNRLMSLRIDYIFVDRRFEVLSHHIQPNIFSDHHLVMAEVEW